MTIPRRSLRKLLVIVGCLFGDPSALSSMLGIGLIVAGGTLHWLSKAYLEQNRELTTAGPYRWTRNPFYVANLVVDVGIACVIARVWVVIAYFPLWAVAYSGTIRVEEARLRALFATRFDDYAAAVPRFFPFRSPLRASLARGRFDLGNPSLTQGREYARLLGIALAPASIWAAESLRNLRLELFDGAHQLDLGLVLLVPALWVFKLGLAETFRRPEVRLLPAAGGGWRRFGWNLGIMSPLLVLTTRTYARGFNDLVAWVVVGLLILASIRAERAARVAIDSALMIAGLALGYALRELWLAVPATLWFGLSGLEEIGHFRSETHEAASSPRHDWAIFPRIVLAGIVGMLVIGIARFWLGN